jgi:hypothetical protein
VLSRIDQERSLLKKILPEKLQVLPCNFNAAALPPNLDLLLTALSPRRELRATFSEFGKICFSERPIRRSWLYQNIGRPFFEAVYVHSYTNFNSFGSLLLANLIWDERAKGEALRQKCSEYFNVDALPQELRDFLFAPNAPFAKLCFQVNVQFYMLGEKLVKVPDREEAWVPDPIQCIRPHYAVANMPCARASGRDKLCQDIVGGCFAMRLYGACFKHKPSDSVDVGLFHFQEHLPKGFSLRAISTHEQWEEENVPAGYWVASPENCQIADTDNHNISQSFYSVVMGKCMQYCDDYRDARPWDGEVTAIVTLHIPLRPGAIEDVQPNPLDNRIAQVSYRIGNGEAFFICEGEPLSSVAQKLFLAYTGSDESQSKNPFEELHNLLNEG